MRLRRAKQTNFASELLLSETLLGVRVFRFPHARVTVISVQRGDLAQKMSILRKYVKTAHKSGGGTFPTSKFTYLNSKITVLKDRAFAAYIQTSIHMYWAHFASFHYIDSVSYTSRPLRPHHKVLCSPHIWGCILVIKFVSETTSS